jgi:hypothetical protein
MSDEYFYDPTAESDYQPPADEQVDNWDLQGTPLFGPEPYDPRANSGLTNYNPADPYANTYYDPSVAGPEQDISGPSMSYDPVTGVNTLYDPRTGQSYGSFNAGKYSSSGIAGGKATPSKNIVKRATDSLKDKESTGRSILDAILAMYAIKSTLDQRKIQNQARGFLGSPDLTRKAVQPTNVIPTRAYGAGAVGQPYKATTYAAEGGIMGLARGGATKPPRYLDGPTDGMADKINTDIDGKQAAKLSHGEFVIPADVVSHLGNGNSKAGADVLYKMMDRVRKARTGTKKQGKQINPAKFMPGGIAGYAGGGAVAFNEGGKTPTAGTSVTSNLSEWAGPYVTDMLSQANALGNQPYQAYTGQLTAGTSPLQQQAFTGYQNFQTPGAIGQAAQTAGNIAGQMQGMQYSPTQFGNQFQAPGAYQAGQFDTGLGPVGSVQSYMNPYLQNVVDVQAREAARQSQINQQADLAKFAQAGAFGGSRDAIMRATNQEALNRQIGGIQATGLQTAYDKALAQRMQEAQMGLNAQQMGEQSRQFGAGQGMTAAQLGAQYGLAGQQLGEQSKQFGANYGLESLKNALSAAQTQGNLGVQQGEMGLKGLAAQLGAGAQQSAIEQQALDAQRAQFEEARAYPYKQLQFKQSMLSGLPISTQSAVAQTTGMQDLSALIDAIRGIGSAT